MEIILIKNISMKSTFAVFYYRAYAFWVDTGVGLGWLKKKKKKVWADFALNNTYKGVNMKW